MAKTLWLPGAYRYDLTKTRGNGEWANGLAGRGLILHVNVSPNGTDYHFFAQGPPSNPNYVCPNWQIYKTPAAGGTVQMLPFNWQSWCQADGNGWGPSVETAGMPGEPLTDFQLSEIARIYRIGHDDYGWKYQVANSVSGYGFGTHVMGGAAWGNHSCPGTIRAAQRPTILAAAQTGDFDMATPAEVWAYEIHLENDTTSPLTPVNDFLQSTLSRVKDVQKDQDVLKTNDATQTSAIAAVSSKVATVSSKVDNVDSDVALLKQDMDLKFQQVIDTINAIQPGSGTLTGKHSSVIDFGDPA